MNVKDMTTEELDMRIEAATMRDSDDWYRENGISLAEQEAELQNLLGERKCRE